jgi:nucleoid-associated protein YgaU
MPTKSLFDKAIDALSTRDELAAADQAKRVAQDALGRAGAEKAARQSAEDRAKAAEDKLAEVLAKESGSRSMEIINFNNQMTLLRTQVASLEGALAQTKIEKDEVIADLEKQIAALQTKAVEEVQETYTVKSGDSLSKIAKAVYGDWKHWKAIYEANKDTIKNPDVIRVGQVFKLPKIG